MMKYMKTALAAAGLLGLTALPASAAVVTNALNLRAGPGLNYQVVAAMPQGARVDTGNCRRNWCRVNWRGHNGWASASYLSDESRRDYRRPYRRDYRRYVPPWGYYPYFPWDNRGHYRDRRYRPGVGFRLHL